MKITIIYPSIPDGKYHSFSAIYNSKKRKAKLYCDGKKLKVTTSLIFQGEV